MTEEIKIELCPFAHDGERRAKVFVNNDLMPQGYTVGCCGCGAQIGYYDSEEDAVIHWNAQVSHTTSAYECELFPAPAGMNRLMPRHQRPELTVPRACGDEPRKAAKIPRPPKPRKWDTMLPKLEELWLGGYSAAECAEIIGQEFSLPITRNSIISAVHRLILRPMNDARRQPQKEEN